MQARRIAGTVAGLVAWAWMTPAFADTVITRENKIFRGTIVSNSELGVTLKDLEGKLVVFYRDEIREVRVTRTEKPPRREELMTPSRERAREKVRDDEVTSSDETPVRPGKRSSETSNDRPGGYKPRTRVEPRFLFVDLDLSPLILSTKGTKAGILTAGAQASLRASLGGAFYLAGGFDFAQSLSQQARNPATVYTAPWGAAEIHLSGLVLGLGAAMASVADGTATTARVSELVPRVTLGYQYRPDSGAKVGINLLYGRALSLDTGNRPKIETWGGFFTFGYAF